MKIIEKWKNRETKKKLRARIAELEKELRFDNARAFNVDRREVRTLHANISKPLYENSDMFAKYAKIRLKERLVDLMEYYIKYNEEEIDGKKFYCAEIKVVDMGDRDGRADKHI